MGGEARRSEVVALNLKCFVALTKLRLRQRESVRRGEMFFNL